MKLHDGARHDIHSFETLGVTIDTLQALQQQVVLLSGKHKQEDQVAKSTEASDKISMHIDAQIRMLRNLLLRSQSNKERLQNEIALVSQHL